MTQEEKQLLLKDLCGRLPYGVILNCCNLVGEKLTSIDENGLINHDYDIDEVKPYLFPMSSMTKEQKKEYAHIVVMSSNLACSQLIGKTVQDWFNENHFDFRGLIPKGLAEDATGKNIY